MTALEFEPRSDLTLAPMLWATLRHCPPEKQGLVRRPWRETRPSPAHCRESLEPGDTVGPHPQLLFFLWLGGAAFLLSTASDSELRGINECRSEWNSRTAVPNLPGTRDQFRGRQFFHGPGMEKWFGDDSSALHLLCTLFLIWASLIA